LVVKIHQQREKKRKREFYLLDRSLNPPEENSDSDTESDITSTIISSESDTESDGSRVLMPDSDEDNSDAEVASQGSRRSRVSNASRASRASNRSRASRTSRAGGNDEFPDPYTSPADIELPPSPSPEDIELPPSPPPADIELPPSPLFDANGLPSPLLLPPSTEEPHPTLLQLALDLAGLPPPPFPPTSPPTPDLEDSWKEDEYHPKRDNLHKFPFDFDEFGGFWAITRGVENRLYAFGPIYLRTADSVGNTPARTPLLVSV
jgi:hypothetical protein